MEAPLGVGGDGKGQVVLLLHPRVGQWQARLGIHDRSVDDLVAIAGAEQERAKGIVPHEFHGPKVPKTLTSFAYPHLVTLMPVL